jgi:aspartate/methionine/tyrosine aminotransferase
MPSAPDTSATLFFVDLESLMSEAESLNRTLEREAPAVARCLSPLGRQAAFPKGIPFQAAAAKSTNINATIGQMTDGHGAAMPLSVMAEIVKDLDTKKTFLYAPVPGHADVSDAWRAREARLAGDLAVPVARPVATHGLTNGLSLLANLFGDPETALIVPTPFWGNYRLIFTMHAGVQVEGFEFFADGGFNLAGLAEALDRVARGPAKKAIVVLNLPGNPTGYALTPEEASQIVGVLDAHPDPMVVVVDDAYQGFVYEDSALKESEFWLLARGLDPEKHAVFKVDGATKELLFFASRLGFVTHPYVTEGAEKAILSKLKYLIRGTVGSPPGPSSAITLHALNHPRLEDAFAERFAVMKARYDALKHAFSGLQSERLVPCPFNAAFFMLLKLDGIDSNEARERLIAEHSIGTIAFAEPNALRIAHCSVDVADIPTMAEKIIATLA